MNVTFIQKKVDSNVNLFCLLQAGEQIKIWDCLTTKTMNNPERCKT